MFLNLSSPPQSTKHYVEGAVVVEKPASNERRKNAWLRVIFDEACWLTTPFFAKQPGGVTNKIITYARQALHEAYPNLSSQDINTLLEAVQRFHLHK